MWGLGEGVGVNVGSDHNQGWLHLGYIGMLENNMETTIVCRVFLIMEKKMEATWRLQGSCYRTLLPLQHQYVV